ncbi:unnamed protein product [Heterobilharzia americana]|nr:unnamed protein product [Heterobilharzia americana]
MSHRKPESTGQPFCRGIGLLNSEHLQLHQESNPGASRFAASTLTLATGLESTGLHFLLLSVHDMV